MDPNVYLNNKVLAILPVIMMLLPVINKYLTDGIQALLGHSIDGRTLSRNSGFALLALFVVTGVLALPQIVLPPVPAEPDIVLWLAFASTVVAEIGGLLAWIIAGSRVYHDAVVQDNGTDELPGL